MKRHLEKTCGRCGCAFTCGLYGCWCADVPVSDALYADIAERFADCLCPSCLKALCAGDLDLNVG